MSSDTAIKVENLSKCYQIYNQPHDRLKQSIYPRLQRVLGKQPIRYYREFWALRDINFEVQQGEAVGILGRNGAGKSTLLQIIAGTVAPTSGRVKADGRITALLELGSGFNPEFTGRENVFLNAQILGLTREDTENRFDDIASFADIGDFIDQPVKTYSSGMMMRLAFAVQTAVNPSVLIVDEALSVGDMFFQAKCMARINKLVEAGLSLLFVSHDLASLRHLCHRAVLLVDGQVQYCGDVGEATSMYERVYLSGYNQRAETYREHKQIAEKLRVPLVLPTGSGMSSIYAELPPSYTDHVADNHTFVMRCNFERLGNGEAHIINVVMVGEHGQTDIFDFGEHVTLLQVAEFHSNMRDVNVSYKIKTLQGTSVVFGDTRMFGDITRAYRAGQTYAFAWEFDLKLGHESYVIQSTLTHPPRNGADWEFIDMVPISFEFRVLPRKAGMTDGLVSWDADHAVFSISS
ncbi:MAG: ABC transporter ATP-binding protein [Nitrospira sp. WS110]|nr:ABC transporter ATP-binding protein [Nitrospira sp. WS110]